MDKLSALESRERFSPGLCESGEDSLTIDDRFEILGDIGGGAYGTVYKARDKSNNGSIVALKKVTVQEDPEIGIPPLVMRELTNLKRLSSPPDNRDPHIVRLLDVLSSVGRYKHEAVFYMVFEHMEQDLDQFIKQCPPPGMHESVIKDFLGQFLRGVDWMHMNNIVHRDLKPQNILVSKDGRRIKIADLGLSRLIVSNVVLSTQVVTQWYRAPEVLLHSSYCKAVDMWSVGCIFAEMQTRRPLFATVQKGEKPQLQEIFRIIGTPAKASWPSQSAISLDQFIPYTPRPWSDLFKESSECAHDLLSKMLRFRGAERITAQDAIQHEYFVDGNSDGYHTPESTLGSPSISPTLLNTSTDSGILDT